MFNYFLDDKQQWDSTSCSLSIDKNKSWQILTWGCSPLRVPSEQFVLDKSELKRKLKEDRKTSHRMQFGGNSFQSVTFCCSFYIMMNRCINMFFSFNII